MRIRPAILSNRRILLSGVVGLAVLIVTLVWWLSRTALDSTPPPIPLTQSAKSAPPWIYGRADARFTIVEYADLECSYCRAYFPVLQQWIREHPEVNWQWHHFPLSVHEPAGMQAARLVECVGESAGNPAFWDAVAWIYQHTHGDGNGLPADARFPGQSPALETCLHSKRPDDVIQAQADAATRDQIKGTPTLRLIDQQTGKTVVLHGPVEGDALLSAIDLLVAR